MNAATHERPVLDRLEAADLRRRADAIAAELHEARNRVEMATFHARELHRDLEHRRLDLPRFEHEVREFFATLIRDLGIESDDQPGGFDLNAVADDARNLVDLIDLARRDHG